MAIESVTGPQVHETAPFDTMKATLGMMKCGVDTLDQLTAWFQVISEKVMRVDPERETIGNRNQIKELASLGKNAAWDMANTLGSERERTLRELGVEALDEESGGGATSHLRR